MDNNLGKTHKLNIYLLKEDYNTFKSSIKVNEFDYNEYPIKETIDFEGIILIGKTKSNTSDWKNLLQQGTDEPIGDIENSSNRALLFFKIDGRIFVLPFGFGKHMLNEESIEREFGLRTALNIMDYEKFVSVDKANISDMTILTKTQSSIRSNPSTFNLDILSDLLRGITGGLIHANSDLGSIVTGSDSINILPKIFFKNIPPILQKLKASYESERYKERFDWIDKLREVKDKAVIETLRHDLIENLKNGDSIKIHIAPPFILDWEEYEGYSFMQSRGDLETDFDIIKYYEYKNAALNDLDWDNLHDQNLYIKYSNSQYRISHKLWRFLNYETTIDEKVYVFSLGKWYLIDSNYIDEIKTYVSSVEESDIDFPDCPSGISEGNYNLLFAGTSIALALFDKELVRSDFMNRSDIELCDVLSLDKKEFIHIKKRYSSATLSHLFAQGKISSFALLRDKSFRKNSRKMLRAMLLDPEIIPLDTFKSSECTITFALIDTADRNFIDALPFFSLINFRLTLESLLLYGYKVKVKNIRTSKP